MPENDDWRIQGQGKYLAGKEFIFREWATKNPEWEHDHCEFCWNKFVAGTKGYCTLDLYYWICETCFNDFKEMFHFKIVDNSRD